MIDEKALNRFESKFIPEPNTGCWLWTATSVKYGYGTFHWRGKDRYAHRVSWELYRGTWPSTLCVLHKCDTPACVNPEHLFLGSRTDNNADCVSKGRNNNQTKTHCINGHELSGDNLYLPKKTKTRSRPYRQCRKCIYAAGKRRNERLKYANPK